MIPKFFGQYLLERGIVKREQLIEAIKYQEENKQKLGEVALDKGYLTEAQIKNIHNEQKTTDLKFGELAIKLGYLNDDQLNELITIQKNNHIFLGEALVKKGFVSQKTIDTQLEKFKEEQKDISPINITLDVNDKYNAYILYYVDLVSKMLLRMADIESKPGKPIIREDKVDTHYLSVYIDITGGLYARLMLSLTKEAVFEIAQKFLGESIDDEDIAMENAGEFLNVVCGNLSSLMEREGKKIQISIPQMIKGFDKPTLLIKVNEKAVVFPLTTTKGYCELQVFIQDETAEQPVKKSGKKTVLIVDDSKSVAFKLGKIIEAMGDFEVAYHALTAEEGIDKYAEIKPDLVTMDIILPGMSGIDAIKTIKDKDARANIIVISSVGGGQEKLFEAIQAGAKNVIVKPFEEERVKEIFYQSV
jgi:CheY-specific phosphatase CheX/ActR/RegA family two-component response regulator